MLGTLDLNTIAQGTAVQLVDCLVEGTLVAFFAALVLGAMRQRSSGTRFAVWFSALMAIAVVPWFGGSLWTHVRGLSSRNSAAVTLPESWAVYVIAVWAVVSVWFFIGILRSVWHLHRLRRSSKTVDLSQLDPRLRQTLERHGTARAVSVCTSELVQVPTAVGLRKPIIVIPAWLLHELSPEDINQILLHELAHLRRWDDWTNLVQKIVRALFFFHPAVWWIENRVSLEREMACDDAVIAETESPRAYAECLTNLAERTFVQRSMALAQAALGRIRQTSLRVTQILDGNRRGPSVAVWRPASIVAAFAIVSVLGVSRAPQLIGFEHSSASSSSVAVNSSNVDAPNIAPLRATNAVYRPQRTPVVNASLKAGNGKASEHRAAMKFNRANVRMAKALAAPLAVSETVYVVIEGNDAPYQIQMWRVTVLRTASDLDRRISHRKI